MPKTLDAATAAAAAAEQNSEIYFLELTLDVPARFNSRRFDRVWNGHTWLGMGRFAGARLGGIEETGEIEAQGFQAELSIGAAGGTALAEKVRGRKARVWYGFLDDAGELVGEPVLLAAGRADRMPVTLGAQGKVVLYVLNRWADWNRVNAARWTDADQKARYAGDRAFEFVSKAAEERIPWGA